MKLWIFVHSAHSIVHRSEIFTQINVFNQMQRNSQLRGEKRRETKTHRNSMNVHELK